MEIKAPPRSGIYSITNTLSGRIYIGQSKNMRARLYTHRTALRAGLHYAVDMQADWLRNGPCVFVASVLLECAQDELANHERRFIAQQDGCYNKMPGGKTGGRPSINDEPMRRVNVMLDQQTIDKASDIGSGNLSAGLRIAVTKHRKRRNPG